MVSLLSFPSNIVLYVLFRLKELERKRESNRVGTVHRQIPTVEISVEFFFAFPSVWFDNEIFLLFVFLCYFSNNNILVSITFMFIFGNANF